MGADYTAHAIIGVRLPDPDDLPRLKTKVRKRAFEHSFDDDGETEFDPKTGKALWTTEFEEVETDEPVVVYDMSGYCDQELVDGQKYLKAQEDGMSFHCGTDDKPIFFGVVVSTGSSNGGDETEFLPMPDIGRVREEIRVLLQPIGLWDERVFGLHVNLYCSY